MKLTTESECTILALLHMARQTNHTYVKADDIIAACNNLNPA